MRPITIVDGDEADALLGEHDLGVVAHLQVVPSEPAQVFDNQGSHMARFNLAQKGVEAGAVEVGAGVAIIPKVPDVPQSMLPGVLLQVHLLERDLSRVFSPNNHIHPRGNNT